MNSKRKGKRGELDAVKFLRSLGFTARRAQQYSGTESTADVIVEELPNIHIEVKYRSDIDIHSQALRDALDQATRDCGGKIPVVLWRKTRGKWALTYWDWTWASTISEPEGIKWWLWSQNGGQDE